MEKIKWSLTSDKMTGTLCKDLCSFMIVSRRIILRTRNVSDEIKKKKNQETFYVQKLFFPENLTVYEMMGENIAQPDRPQMTI